jgi:hypothetical protein
MLQEKIKKIKNYLFSNEEVIFAYCYGDYLQETGYKNARLSVGVYFDKKVSFNDHLNYLSVISSKFYENLSLDILNNDIEEMNPVFLYDLVLNGELLFIKNQKIYDLWLVDVLNFYIDTETIREKVYV